MTEQRPKHLDILLHPQRYAMGRVFERARRLTVRELAQRLPDIPVSSLYRHVARMVDAGMLVAVAERRPDAPRDVVYEFRDKPADLQSGAPMEREKLRALVRHVSHAIHEDVAQYLEREPDIVADGTSAFHTYRRVTAGDLERMRDFARWIATLPEDDDAPGDWFALSLLRFPAPIR